MSMKFLLSAALVLGLAAPAMAAEKTTHHNRSKKPVATTAQAAPEQNKERAGTLSCRVDGGVGFVVGSSKAMNCTFEGANGKQQKYTGNILMLGVDVGITTETQLLWLVMAPSSSISAGSLAGKYVGLSAEATVGAGVGANILVGGSQDSFSLQPLSIQGQKGLNVAAGIASITLEAVAEPVEKKKTRRSKTNHK